jgi:hypothetical protein
MTSLNDTQWWRQQWRRQRQQWRQQQWWQQQQLWQLYLFDGPFEPEES